MRILGAVAVAAGCTSLCPEGFLRDDGLCLEQPAAGDVVVDTAPAPAPVGDDDGDGWTVSDGDCDDDDPAVHSEAIEECNEAADLDCDGATGFDDDDCCALECDCGGQGLTCGTSSISCSYDYNAFGQVVTASCSYDNGAAFTCGYDYDGFGQLDTYYCETELGGEDTCSGSC